MARALAVADRLDGAGGSPAAADTAAGLALLDLLARSAPDDARFEAAMRLCAHAEALGLDGRAPHHPIGTRVGGYLIARCPPARHVELTRRVLTWKPRAGAIGLIRHFGPARALELLRDAGDEHLEAFLEGARSLLAGTTYTEPFPEVPTPSVPEWDAAWLELALEHRSIGLVRELAELDPERVATAVAAMDRPPHEWALLALTVDPGCAARLPVDALTGRQERVGHTRAVCAALAAGERDRALALAERALAGRGWIEGMWELHDRLARDAGEPA